MGRLVLGVSSLLSIVALALAGFGVATNHWVRLHRPDDTMNPVEVNSQMTFTTIKYPARYFGLWYGCYREDGSAVSCAYITHRCTTNVCWKRMLRDTVMDTVCQRNDVGPIAPHCAAFQVTRIFACIGLVLLVVATTCMASAFVAVNRGFAAVGGLASILGALATIIATSVFYAHQMSKSSGLGVDGLASIGWSFWLLMASAPLSVLAAVGACAAASVFIGAKEYDVDLSSLG